MIDQFEQPATVLLIEDDDASQYVYGAVLAHHGFTVIPVRTGLLALEALEGPLPDAVVLDIGLPGLDGFDLLARIRANPRTAPLPVLVVTVHVFEADELRARQAGCDVFLKKPLQPALLAAEVKRILADGRAPAAPERL